jgi:hypothetical protein
MIRHREVPLDHGSDSRKRPPLGLEAGPLGAPGEDREQLLPLGGCQTRWAPRLGLAAQPRKSPRHIAESLCPLANGCRADAESPGDLGLRETASAEQATGCEPTLFELFWGEFVRSPHAFESNSRASGR